MQARDALCVDVLVVGAGAAGLWAAGRLARAGVGRIALVAKGPVQASSTWHAQGGIAAALADDDSVERHVQDTLRTGCGLCREEVVRAIVARGRAIIEELLALGAPLDRENGRLHLTREGGHSRRRIAHAKDATGRAIAAALADALAPHPEVLRLTGWTAVDLVTRRRLGMDGEDRCLGAYFLDAEGRVRAVAARWTILATGGASRVFLITSNPHVASGDGIAMAWRAFAPIANMEFEQFHPTCLHHPAGSHFLLTEALRGEGAILVDAQGRRFMPDYHPDAELAPRDVVARAIDAEMKRQGADCMYLDARPIGAAKIRRRFPTIHARLLELGLDMTRQPVPVAPAAHYTVGGVDTDEAGQTAIPGLFAIGEVAYSGLHGANRLASNSLLECLAMAELAAERILGEPAPPMPEVPAWRAEGVRPPAERIAIKQNWDEVRMTMQNYVGVVRTDARLARALARLSLIREEVEAYYWRHPLARDLVELRNLALVAELIAKSALLRRESRGLHYNPDHPGMLDAARDTILTREEDGR